jgi:tetratricopeptide (TPR) repeat protein
MNPMPLLTALVASYARLSNLKRQRQNTLLGIALTVILGSIPWHQVQALTPSFGSGLSHGFVPQKLTQVNTAVSTPAMVFKSIQHVQPFEGPTGQMAFIIAVEMAQEGRLNQALTPATQATRLLPRHADAWALKGDIHRATDQHQEAIQAYEHWSKLEPKNLEAQSRLASAYLTIYDTLNALKTLQPFDTPAHAKNYDLLSLLGVIYTEHGALKDAERVSLQELALVKSLPETTKQHQQYKTLLLAEAHNNLAYVYANQKAFNKALPLIETSLKLNPESEAALDTYGYILAGLGKHKEAVLYYTQAIKRNGTLPEIFHHRAQSLYTLKELSASETDYQYVLTVYPTYAKTHGVLQEYQARFKPKQ